MRTRNSLLTGLVLLLLACPAGDIQAQSTADPAIPTGFLTAYPTQVQTGAYPELTWEIEIPETVTEVVTITPPGTVTPKRDLCMEVRIVGASVKRVWTQNGRVVDWEWVNTECRMKYGGGNYSRIFYGKQDEVDPDEIVHAQIVTANNSINFGGRYVQSNGSWSTWRSSTNSSQNVIALKDGDNPPDVDALYGQQTVEDFLRPYMDNQGNIDIGPKDVIYLIELTHTNMNDGGFDLQDLVILVTFNDPNDQSCCTTCQHGNGNNCSLHPRSNNGHGNNVDGVDSSNPGQGGGGPTGDNNSGNDPSGGYDDEGATGTGSSSSSHHDDDDDDDGYGDRYNNGNGNGNGNGNFNGHRNNDDDDDDD